MMSVREALEAARDVFAAWKPCDVSRAAEIVNAALRELDEAQPVAWVKDTSLIALTRDETTVLAYPKDYLIRPAIPLYTTPPDVLAVLKDARPWIENLAHGEDGVESAAVLLARIDKLLEGR